MAERECVFDGECIALFSDGCEAAHLVSDLRAEVERLKEKLTEAEMWANEMNDDKKAAEKKLAEAKAEIAELRKLPTVTEREELEEKLAEARAFLTVERGERENLAELLEQLTLAVGAPDFAEAVRLAIAEREKGGG